MKRVDFIISILTTIIVLGSIGCNPVEPDDDIIYVQEQLVGEWVRSKSHNIIDTSIVYDTSSAKFISWRKDFMDENKCLDTIYVYDILNTNALRFTNKMWAQGAVIDGSISFSDDDKYSLYKNDNGTIFLRTERNNENHARYKYYQIEKTSSNNLQLLFIDSTYIDAGILTYRHTYYIHPNMEDTEERDKRLSALQKKMEGEWYVERQRIVTDYENGYTADNGETHTDTTVVFTDNFFALKVNCEFLPSTSENSSTYQIGTYSNGVATYDIIPSNYNIEGIQYYVVSFDEEENFQAQFMYYLPIQKDDGSYMMSSVIFLISYQEDNSMTTERSEWKRITKLNGGEIKELTVYRSTITEYWKRQP